MCPRAGALGGTAAPRLAWGMEQGRAQSPSEMPGAGGSRRVWPLLALSPRLERGQERGCSPWLLRSLLRHPLPVLSLPRGQTDEDQAGLSPHWPGLLTPSALPGRLGHERGRSLRLRTVRVEAWSGEKPKCPATEGQVKRVRHTPHAATHDSVRKENGATPSTATCFVLFFKSLSPV